MAAQVEPHSTVRLRARDGMKSIRECGHTGPSSIMKTLVWTRGPSFALSQLGSRLICTRCDRDG
jgi:hypothetical protein